MQRIAVKFALGVWLMSMAIGATAKEPVKFDPAARGRLISRFMADDAVAVGHLDVTRLKVESLFAELKRMPLGDPQQIDFTRTAVEESVELFLKAGGREAFVVLSPAASPLLVVPLAADADEATILAILGQAPFEATEKLAGALVAGSAAAVARVRDARAQPRPELTAGFAAAGDTAAQMLLVPTEDNRKVVEQMLPNLPAELGGASTRPVARGLNWLALGVDGPPKLALRLVADATDARAAGELKSLLAGVFDALSKQAEFVKLFPDQAGLRALLTPKTNQNQLVLELAGQPLIEQLKAPLGQARDAAKRTQSVNNLKQLGLAMHNYHAVHQTFPPAIHAKDGKPLLSWRVFLLPFVEQQRLYERFHLDEPWDSPHNKQLIAEMPDVFRSPFSQVGDQGRTVYLTPRGAETVFPGQQAIKLRDISDGTSNTILLVEVDDEHAVSWTRPDDWDFDPQQPTRGLRLVNDTGYTVGYCDGSVQVLAKQIKPATLRALLTRAGGEVIPADRQ